MCNRIRMSERFVYLEVKVPRERYESLVRAFGLRESHALRHLRLRWESTYARGLIDEVADGSLRRIP